MKFGAPGLVLCLVMAGCGDGTPFNGETDTTDGGTTGTDTGATLSRDGLPAGTASPTPNDGIYRSETPDPETGNGQATSYQYNGADDTFTIDGLAFDGDNVYTRGTAVSSLGPYAVYEAPKVVQDSQSQVDINQLRHRAIYGVSKNLDGNGNPETQFAIVRTGAYVGYGFGGFIYTRENGVSIETAAGAQGSYTGKTAGIRDFGGKAELQYTTGDLTIEIDFGDFNPTSSSVGDGVKARWTNRRIFDVDGVDVTNEVLADINTANNASIGSLPDAQFTIGPGSLDSNGEIIGTVVSGFEDNVAEYRGYESGKYYAILSGTRGQEIVGVMVLENTTEDPDIRVRETSGFIVYRGPAP
ncbi:hypothetical protein [Roseobacter sp. GAI101]|uniref:hypothetical protein n=1 Tax=Roseobacter sp. (strain GAI101) TaxID=391589 RepID=UPI0002E078DA|nr:hypothetical protein [Roseobacter sp. GAI101]